ncbi:hypothetical protein C8A00DRAFT_40617 [Chaetomidium leptoderma]|uniref:F-box domain-containing protein n=1 Tax=Chaetomidium leptoderma TaxID=669021 RepID=A0AAN6VSE1_9PEZI|nr:hypothetical protein C8A00DRAFT_40617 [Chaetomidium leptoderma]
MPPQLQDLPAEILLLILASTGSLPDLRALASTSPRIYAVFQSDQAELIYQALANELGPVFADALGLSLIQVLDGSSRGYVDQLGDALCAYGAYLAQNDGGGGGLQSHHHHADPSPRRQRLSLDHVLRLARSYRAMALVAGAYTTCALKLFEREARSSSSLPGSVVTAVAAPPSRAEQLRVLRAHYRLQMLLHFWGSWEYHRLNGTDAIDRITLYLFGLWELWEVQQTFCVGTVYDDLRYRLAEVLYRGDPDKSPQSALLSRNFHPLDEFRDFVRQVRATDEAAWQETLERASSFPSGMEAAGRDEEQLSRCFRNRLWQHCEKKGPPEKHRFPASLRFDGDCVGAVPFGWVDAFDGHYGYNLYEKFGAIRREGKPTQGLWSRLGFVMWDEPRVEALKTLSFLSHCTTGWARSGRSTEAGS